MQTKKVVYQGYSDELDRTIIFEDVYEGEEMISSTIKGFYYGKPSEEGMKEFYNKTQAAYK